jgi:hypothetical protein
MDECLQVLETLAQPTRRVIRIMRSHMRQITMRLIECRQLGRLDKEWQLSLRRLGRRRCRRRRRRMLCVWCSETGRLVARAILCHRATALDTLIQPVAATFAVVR